MSHAGNGPGSESNLPAYESLPCQSFSVIAQTDVLAFELPADIAIELFTSDASVWSYFYQVGQVIPSVWKGVQIETQDESSDLSKLTRGKRVDTHHDDPLAFRPRPGEIYHL